MTLRIGLSVVFCIVGLLALAPPSAAQTLIQPKSDLPLREVPPGLWQSKGGQIGTASASVTYRVIEKRLVRTIAGTEQWLRIQSPDGRTQGWIFSGPSDRPEANVTVIGR